MNLSLEIYPEDTENDKQQSGKNGCVSKMKLNKKRGERCIILFKKYQDEHIYSSKNLNLLLSCGTSYNIQAYCSNQLLPNVVRIFIPCPLNGNYVLNYKRGTAAANCLPGAVVLCEDINQQGACSCRQDCILTKNCCPEICSSQFCSLSLNIATMCNSLSKEISVPQVFQTCPIGNGPSDSSCSSHGICSALNGTCHCFDGYLPPDCSSRNYECPQNCYGDQGVCIMGQCLCFAGYGGEGCRYRKCPQDNDTQVCSGNGKCISLTGRCECNISWYGNECNNRTNNSQVNKWMEDSSIITKQQSNGTTGSVHSSFNTVTIPNWPMPVSKPEPVSREQLVIIFNEIIDFPIFNFTEDIWSKIVTNLSQKTNVSRNNVFLVHFSKYQETFNNASQQLIRPDPCLKNLSCSIQKVTLESSQQGKTSIGVAVLTNVKELYSIRGIIREYAMQTMTHQLNVTARLNGNLVVLSFNNGVPKPSRGKIAFLSVVAFFVFAFSMYISIFAIRNELHEEKYDSKIWLTLPAADEDAQGVLLEELILTGTKIDWFESALNDRAQGKHTNVHQTQANSTTTLSTNKLRRRPPSQLTSTQQQ